MNLAYIALVIVGLGLGALEIIIRRRRRNPVNLRQGGVSLAVGVLAYSSAGISQLMITTLAYWATSHAVHWHLSVWNPMVWIAYIAIDDFAGYWAHRASHRFRFLWAAHLVHHSPDDLTMMGAARLSPVEAFYQPLVNLWAPLLGFPIAIYAPLTVVSLLFDQLQHTRLIGRHPRVDRWLASPSNHRVHHAKNALYIDRNFGGWTMIWDRLFGTYTAETEAPVFGVTDRLAGSGVLATAAGGYPALLHDMAAAPSFDAAVAAAIARPGSHLGYRDRRGETVRATGML